MLRFCKNIYNVNVGRNSAILSSMSDAISSAFSSAANLSLSYAKASFFSYAVDCGRKLCPCCVKAGKLLPAEFCDHVVLSWRTLR